MTAARGLAVVAPATMLLHLAAVITAVPTASVVLVIGCCIAPGAIVDWAAQPPWLDAIERIAPWMIAAVVVAAAVGLIVELRRLMPLHRCLRRRAADPAAPVPPSIAALRDGYVTPHRLTAIVVAPLLTVALVDAILAPNASADDGFPASALWTLDLAVVAAGLLAASPTFLLVRRALWPWLGAFGAHETDLRFRPWLPLRFALPPFLAIAGCAFLCAALFLAQAGFRYPAVQGIPSFALLAILVAGLAGASVAFLIARRAGSDLATDARNLTMAVRELTRSDAIPSSEDVVSPQVAALGKAMTTLADAFAQTEGEEERARQAVQEAQRLKTQFMAAMSHDLRSPLNSILGFADLLKNGTSGPLASAQMENVDIVRRGGRELLRLVDEVLDTARLEAGRLALRREWTPSVEILTEAMKRGKVMIEGRKLDIVAQLQPGLPPVYVDADRVVQAVTGLLGHAARVMEQGTIRLEASVATMDLATVRKRPRAGRPSDSWSMRHARYLRVDVTDGSAGIRDEDRKRIFEAFREVVSPSGRRLGGLGLGLSLARALVREHGGDVWFESRGPTGTTFTVALPLEGPEPTGKTTMRSAGRNPRRRPAGRDPR